MKRAKPLKEVSNNIAELEALIEGLNLSINLGIKKLIIEGDSQIILNAIKNPETPNWKIKSKLEYAITLLNKLEEIRIQHIYREGNKKQIASQKKEQMEKIS